MSFVDSFRFLELSLDNLSSSFFNEYAWKITEKVFGKKYSIFNNKLACPHGFFVEGEYYDKPNTEDYEVQQNTTLEGKNLMMKN